MLWTVRRRSIDVDIGFCTEPHVQHAEVVAPRLRVQDRPERRRECLSVRSSHDRRQTRVDEEPRTAATGTPVPQRR